MKNKYGEDRTPINQKDAEKGMNNLISRLREHMPDIDEKSFWLCLEDNMWVAYANSVIDNCTGDRIKEFLVKEL